MCWAGRSPGPTWGLFCAQSLGPAGKISVRDGGCVTVPPGLHRAGALGSFLLLWQQVQVEPGVGCTVVVVVFHYLMELRMDPTTCISFSLFLLKDPKPENLTL